MRVRSLQNPTAAKPNKKANMARGELIIVKILLKQTTQASARLILSLLFTTVLIAC